MGQIRITSDGTIAGTSIIEESTGVAITGVRGMELGIDTLPDGTKVLLAKITVRRPILQLENVTGEFKVE